MGARGVWGRGPGRRARAHAVARSAAPPDGGRARARAAAAARPNCGRRRARVVKCAGRAAALGAHAVRGVGARCGRLPRAAARGAHRASALGTFRLAQRVGAPRGRKSARGRARQYSVDGRCVARVFARRAFSYHKRWANKARGAKLMLRPPPSSLPAVERPASYPRTKFHQLRS